MGDAPDAVQGHGERHAAGDEAWRGGPVARSRLKRRCVAKPAAKEVRSLGRGEDGIGLIDAILALVVLLVILVASSSLVDDIAKQANHSKEQVSAAEIAEQWLERLANDPLSTLQGDINQTTALTSTPDVVAGVGYSAQAQLAWGDTGASENACTSGNPPQIILATVTVTWAQQSLAESTVIDPPYGTAVATDGYISVQIVGASGSSVPTGVTGLTVNIGGTNYSPDSQGCVFQQETPGTYTVTLTSSSGNYIDFQELTAPSSSVTVAAGGTQSISFYYDQAATVSFSASNSPVATGMPVSVGNTQLTPVAWKTVVAAGASPETANLFPYQSGYTAWFGDCTAEVPSSPASFAVSPATSTSATLTGLIPLDLQLSLAGGTPLYNATLSATVNDSGAPDKCPSDVFGLQPPSGTSPNPAFSVTEILPQKYTIAIDRCRRRGRHQHQRHRGGVRRDLQRDQLHRRSTGDGVMRIPAMSRIGRGAALRRGWRARRAQRRSQSERGFTLMETLIACAVMVVVIASTVPVVRVFFDEQLAVNRTYSGADEVLLTSLVMTRYIREAVEPAPENGSGVPTAPFVTATPCSLTFYANVGNANGPAQVVAAASPCTGTGQTFLMTIQAPDTNSCPVTGSTGTACTYTTQPVKRLVYLTNVTNNTLSFFSYTLTGGSTTTTAGKYCGSADTNFCTTPGYSCPSGASTCSAGTRTTLGCSSGAGNCELDEIIAVSVDIQADLSPGTPSGFQTLAFLVAPTYNAAAG